MKTFGEVISERQKQERGLTQKALAAQVKKKDGIAIGMDYINDIEHDRETQRRPISWRRLAAVFGSTTRGYCSTTQDGSLRTRKRAILHMNRLWGSLPRLSEGDRQKAEVTMEERAAAKRQPRPVNYTRDQLDHRCEQIIVGASAWRATGRN